MIKIASFAVVILFIAMSGATLAISGNSLRNDSVTLHIKNNKVRSFELASSEFSRDLSFVNNCKDNNWAGYGFFNMPWDTFGHPEEINWVSECVHVPNCVKPAPSSETSVRSCISGWDALSSNNQGDNMWQSGFIVNPYSDQVKLFSEHFYCAASYGACFYNYTNNDKKPVTPGSNLYIYLTFNGNKFCSVITDETNGESYHMSRNFINQPLSPKFFLSVIETPLHYGQLTSVPTFSQFEVNTLCYYSGGESISGSNSHCTGSYAKYNLCQKCGTPNIKVSFNPYYVENDYEVTYLTSDR